MARCLLFVLAALLALLAALWGPLGMGLIAGEWAKEWPPSSMLSLLNYFTMAVMPYQVRLLEYVMKESKEGDVDSVIGAIDDFCWRWPTMNVGPVKGEIADKALAEMAGANKAGKVVVELGSYMGYSTLRFGRALGKLPGSATLYSVDPNPLGHAAKLASLDRAGLLRGGGLGNVTVRNELDFSGNVLKRLAKEGVTVDYLFLDHVKDLYREDAELALTLGLLKKGSVIVADNVLAPGAPEYRRWMLAHKAFSTKVHETLLEYTKAAKDEVLVSVLL